MLVGVGRGDTDQCRCASRQPSTSPTTGWSGARSRRPMQLIGQMIDVVATDDGLFAVGGVPGADAAGVWHSADAETWERVGGDLEHAFLWSIAEGGARPGRGRLATQPRCPTSRCGPRRCRPDLGPGSRPGGLRRLRGHRCGGAARRHAGHGRQRRSSGSGGRIWTSPDGVAWTLAVDAMDGVYAALPGADSRRPRGRRRRRRHAGPGPGSPPMAPSGRRSASPCPSRSSHRPLPPRMASWSPAPPRPALLKPVSTPAPASGWRPPATESRRSRSRSFPSGGTNSHVATDSGPYVPATSTGSNARPT